MTANLNTDEKETIGQMMERAFLEGYLHGVEQFAVWKNGEQLVGVMGMKLSEIRKSAIQDVADPYRSFMARRAKEWEAKREPPQEDVLSISDRMESER